MVLFENNKSLIKYSGRPLLLFNLLPEDVANAPFPGTFPQTAFFKRCRQK